MSAPILHDTGEGPPLVLLHAYPLDASQWDAQVASLGDRYRCLRPDFWGCAGSPAPPPGATIDGFASAVLTELDRLGVDEFAVCGSSMGGYAVFGLLRAAAQRVRAIVLSGSRAAADDEATRAGRAAVADQVRAAGVEVIVEPSVQRLLCGACRTEVHIADPLRGRARRWTAEGVIAALGALRNRPDSTPMLAGIDVPTLVVCGSDDAVVPLDEAAGMAAAIPGAELAAFAGAGHLCNLEQPQVFSERVGTFLDARWLSAG